jgi:hypothetical protein
MVLSPRHPLGDKKFPGGNGTMKSWDDEFQGIMTALLFDEDINMYLCTLWNSEWFYIS